MGRRPSNRWELLTCALQNHVLVGTDAAAVGDEHRPVVREEGGLRWHRCLRCDGWFPRHPPEPPGTQEPPGPDQIDVPLRGRALRDRYVLRLIAAERALHVLIFGGLAAGIFVLALHRHSVQAEFTRIVSAFYGTGSGAQRHGLLGTVQHFFQISPRHLEEAGVALAAYAVMEAVECVGLWRGRRWAEYLTFVATIVFIPYEVYEMVDKFSAFKAIAFALNVAVAVYLLLAKRLFGLRGGAAAEEARHHEEAGWPAIVRTAPPLPGAPGAGAALAGVD